MTAPRSVCKFCGAQGIDIARGLFDNHYRYLCPNPSCDGADDEGGPGFKQWYGERIGQPIGEEYEAFKASPPVDPATRQWRTLRALINEMETWT